MIIILFNDNDYYLIIVTSFPSASERYPPKACQND